MWGWRRLPVPVIAAVHGVAFGGGFQLALGADMRFLTPDARMSIMEIKWGLVPDMAGTPIPSLVRDESCAISHSRGASSRRRRPQPGPCDAHCDEPRAAALEAAREIAGKIPEAIRAAKRMLKDLRRSGPGAAGRIVEQKKLIGRPNQREAVRANWKSARRSSRMWQNPPPSSGECEPNSDKNPIRRK